jgi:polar amino acid transport system substrate-binding protein
MASSGVATARSGERRARRVAVVVAVSLAAVLACVAVRPIGRFAGERPFAGAVARGVLVVAVPSRPAPTLTVGRVDRTVRAPDGYAAALAEDIGRRAGLPVRLLLADGDAARAAVGTGDADMAIAGLSFAPDASVAFAPTAYTSGRGMALVLRHGVVQDWRDLTGHPICASRGSPFADHTARRFGASVQAFDRPLDALLAFQAGDCAALIDDEYVIRKLLKQPDWTYYRSLPGFVPARPAFIASAGGDAVSADFIERVVQGWQRQRWLRTVREDEATRLAFEMFNAENDLYCH